MRSSLARAARCVVSMNKNVDWAARLRYTMRAMAVQVELASLAAPEHRFVSNADASCRMFKADWLESLSHVRPWVPHLIFVPAIIVALVAALRADTAGPTAVLVLGGLIFWTLTEYVIHRSLFHPPEWIEDDTRHIVGLLDPGDAVITALPTWRHKFYFLVHGVHHDYPNDSTRLVMPPSVSIPLAAVFFLLFRAVLGPGAAAAFAGFAAGYLAYDTIHFATHHASTRSALARMWKQRHFRHHYADSSRDFGVSSPLWDVVLGTIGKGRSSYQ
jgi:sterol desaturase/sphingolipid hydroxylase (fatty acid hydroxylase superfamily)